MDDTTTQTNTAENAPQEDANTTTSTQENGTASQEDTSQQPDPRVTRANKEAADYRIRAREAEKQRDEAKAKLETLMAALGNLTGTQTAETTPEQQLAELQRQNEEMTARLRAEQVANAVNAHAAAKGVDVNVLVPLLRGMGALDNLDPAGEHFQADLAAKVEETITKYPYLVPTTATQSSGNPAKDHPPESKGNMLTREDLARLRDERRWDEIITAQREGRIQY